ncbi:MAG: tRNA (adenosine(37)-N6)-dimethylallyltransferase MiaA [Alphaproteobacteria bacterium]
MKNVICIAGPTASGKSAWAVEVAKKCEGEIINADSMQVYADLQIISARPTEDEMDGVPHHMFGHIDGSARYSTGQWCREVMGVIKECVSRDKTPILIGGTGLYFRALTVGLAPVPEPSAEGTSAAQFILDAGIEGLRAEAERVDPVAAARVLGNDPQRLLRIVSVALGTGKSLSAWQADTKPMIAAGTWKGAIILPDRAALYEKINTRFDNMMESGGIDEIKKVAARGLSPDLPMMKAIGLPPLLSYLRGELSLEDALFEAKRDTRRFAKRQFTWFRGQSEGWICVENALNNDVF